MHQEIRPQEEKQLFRSWVDPVCPHEAAGEFWNRSKLLECIPR